ncbi:hypothetical protein BDN70DRAFT_871230 [Pholiota conissans]|uniref:Yeast cell wall synthesis Kre9/Knh1-like N-terminal domain-containing protein n=1 Tax=Pholiota conissans TaxID=109636 RepID=A0A9P5ZEA9_9AGAR|nr:hypothetical protein BDN70DRAFT_871230 [Pholiota conissans]
MFAAYTFAALLALATPYAARADVTPSTPGPGDSFTAGQTCHITWQGDTVSTTVWKNMAIELMSGQNLDMNHITTVATGQDGTVDGTFDYPCPEVNPYSAIYFYQFSAPGTTTKMWTTRFTIASPSGATTPPANPTQPGSNTPIPWGVGALVDPSKAVPAPAFAADPASNSTTGPATGTTATTTPATTPAATTPAATTTPTLTKVTTPAAVTNIASTTTAANSTAGNSTSSDTKGSGAAALSLSSTHIWMSTAALLLAAFAW